MKILYGVSGVGLGHAVRSSVIINHLQREHDVSVWGYGNAKKVLSEYLFNEIEGLLLHYEKNRIRPLKTFFHNLVRLPALLARNISRMSKVNPDIVITDFEPFSYWFAKKRNIPVIGVDNVRESLRRDVKAPLVARVYARFLSTIISPKCDKYLVPSFYSVARMKHTEVYPPVLRSEILNAKITTHRHILVYFSSPKYEETLIEVFSKFPHHSFYVYGYDKKKTVNNVIFFDFSEKEFIAHLASCRAVITYAGFNVIAESLQLKKPVLAVPITDHYEQLANAQFVAEQNYGLCALSLSYFSVREFFKNMDEYDRALKNYMPSRNELLARLDEVIDEFKQNA